MQTASDFIKKLQNPPVLFIGTGISHRYLSSSYTWDQLLNKIANSIYLNQEDYLDMKAECYDKKTHCLDYPLLGSKLEEVFNRKLKSDREGPLKAINDLYYKNAEQNIFSSRFKLYISELLKDTSLRTNILEEYELFKKTRDNSIAIVTTNYDKFIEEAFKISSPLIGNNILLNSPFGSLYKIHGCVSQPDTIVITKSDYDKVKKQEEIIRAQLISLFAQYPIIFLGYGSQDENVNSILKTIFEFAGSNSDLRDKMTDNFLLVEYEKNSTNNIITEDSKEFDGVNITFNKLVTDNYSQVYKAIIEAHYPISALTIKRVQNRIYDIYQAIDNPEIESINKSVKFVGSPEDFDNQEKVLFITIKDKVENKVDEVKEKIITITRPVFTPINNIKSCFINYFNLIEDYNYEKIESIKNLLPICKTWSFPAYAFTSMHPFDNAQELRQNQLDKIESQEKMYCRGITNIFNSIEDIEQSDMPKSHKKANIIAQVKNGKISIESIERYLKGKKKIDDFDKTIYLLYDYMKFMGKEVKI